LFSCAGIRFGDACVATLVGFHNGLDAQRLVVLFDGDARVTNGQRLTVFEPTNGGLWNTGDRTLEENGAIDDGQRIADDVRLIDRRRHQYFENDVDVGCAGYIGRFAYVLSTVD
jgi:hypothetical protein